MSPRQVSQAHITNSEDAAREKHSIPGLIVRHPPLPSYTVDDERARELSGENPTAALTPPTGLRPLPNLSGQNVRLGTEHSKEGNDTETNKVTASTAQNPPMLRKRTKTGCLTCRKRRIKCGEERPSCVNCIESKRNCEGYTPVVRFKHPQINPQRVPTMAAMAKPEYVEKKAIDEPLPGSLTSVPIQISTNTNVETNQFSGVFDGVTETRVSRCQQQGSSQLSRLSQDHSLLRAELQPQPFSELDLSLRNDLQETISEVETSTSVGLNASTDDPNFLKESTESTLVETHDALIHDPLEKRNLPQQIVQNKSTKYRGKYVENSEFSYWRLWEFKNSCLSWYMRLVAAVVGALFFVMDVLRREKEPSPLKTVALTFCGGVLLTIPSILILEGLIGLSLGPVSRLEPLRGTFLPKIAAGIMKVLLGLYFFICLVETTNRSRLTEGSLAQLLFITNPGLLTFPLTITLLMIYVHRIRWEPTIGRAHTYLWGILEPPLAEGKSRAHWRCRCGRKLYDDFYEVQSGAVKRLEQRLNKQSGIRKQASSDSDAVAGSSNSDTSLQNSMLNSTSFAWKSAQSRSPALPLFQQQTQPDQNIITPAPPRPEHLFLLLCIPYRKHATKLVHMDVCFMPSDKRFFPRLKSHYHEMRGRWSSFFSLRTLKSIRFVHFEMYKSELVDIRKINDVPPETKKDEYHYLPFPPEVIPPVGENHLMHLYHHPEDAEDTGICFQKIPKKLRQRLLVCPNRGTGLGWGIHFVEGLHWTKFWWLGLSGFLASIAFGAAWSVLKSDVQGGFGVTACMMVVLAFTTGILQAAFEPN